MISKNDHSIKIITFTKEASLQKIKTTNPAVIEIL
jgi:hypothetical protein